MYEFIVQLDHKSAKTSERCTFHISALTTARDALFIQAQCFSQNCWAIHILVLSHKHWVSLTRCDQKPWRLFLLRMNVALNSNVQAINFVNKHSKLHHLIIISTVD